MSTAYYNDNDAFVAQWLRNLIAAGKLTPGDVDERPIQEVAPDDVRGYDRVHWFAGIGGWELALQLSGWEDPCWTGSCPCQPFSNAGRRAGATDARHLWPDWHRLISECRPDTVFGEQVAGAVGFGWLDGVCGDLEGDGYAVGAAVLGAHSVGAPHIRQRLWWVADADESRRGARRAPGERRETWHRPEGVPDGLGNAPLNGVGPHCGQPGAGGRPQEPPGGSGARLGEPNGAGRRAGSGAAEAARHGRSAVAAGGGLADATERGCRQGSANGAGGAQRNGAAPDGARPGHGGTHGRLGDARGAGLAQRVWAWAPGEDGAHPWAASVAVGCADGRTRRTREPQPGLLLLDDGIWCSLATVQSAIIERAAKGIIQYAEEAGCRPDQVLRELRRHLEPQAIHERQIGGSGSVSQAEVLLHFLRDVVPACDRSAYGGGGKETSATDSPSAVRSVWEFVEAKCPPYRRQSDEQPDGKSATPLRELSWFLARCCEASRDCLSRSYAAHLPLAIGVKRRVGQLRGFGNAIVPQVAAMFVRAYMECRP